MVYSNLLEELMIITSAVGLSALDAVVTAYKLTK